MELKRVQEISEAMIESDYAYYRDNFLEIARTKYPRGFRLLEHVNKVSLNDGTGEFGYDVQLSEGLIGLIEYLKNEFDGRSPHLRDAVFRRIIDDLLTNRF
jgi:hypothetical protein